jgi:uncharacterized protein (TIGR02246 family)
VARFKTVHGIVIVLSLGVVGESSAQKNARTEIEAVNKQFAAAVSRGDATAVGALYSGKAQVFAPNAPVVAGRTAIEAMWKGVFGAGIAGASLTSTEVETHGETAIESGTYEMTLKDGKVADRGKYIVIWKRENGQWRIHRDIWNTNMPAGK